MANWTKEKIRILRKKYPAQGTDILELLRSHNRGSIKAKASKLGIKNNRWRGVDEKFFEKWSEEMAYVLGYWYADGNMSTSRKAHTASFHSKDRAHLEKIVTLLKSNYATGTHNNFLEKTGRTYKLHSHAISNAKIYNDILKLGGRPRKSLINRFPHMPKKYVRHFIRGYFDGDGSVSISEEHGNYPHINVLGTKQFLSVMMGHFPHQTRIMLKKDSKIYVMHYTGKNAQDVLDYMYGGSKLYLDRKYKKYELARAWIPAQIHSPWIKEDVGLLYERYPQHGSNIPELLKRHGKNGILNKAIRLGIRYVG